MACLEAGLIIAKVDFQLAPRILGEVGGGTPGCTDGRACRCEHQLYDVIAGQHDAPYLVFISREGICIDSQQPFSNDFKDWSRATNNFGLRTRNKCTSACDDTSYLSPQRIG